MTPSPSTYLPDPHTAPELFEGVLVRRSLAYLIDLAILGIMTITITLVGLAAGVATLGLAIPGLILAIPLAIVLYYAATLGSSRRATIGMSIMDVVLTPARGQPLNGWQAFLHPLLFWISCWVFLPFSLLFALFTPRRQMLHDLVMGTLMVRRSPMERHWRRHGRMGDASPENY